MNELLEKYSKLSLYAKDSKRQILEVRFNNPDLKNALDLAMKNEAGELMAHLRTIKPRVLIFRGEGEVFSAGGDLNFLHHLTTLDQKECEAIMHDFYAGFLQLSQWDCPTIAFINGHAVGAGFCFALACDLVYGYDQAKVGLNFTALGIPPGMGGEFWVKQKLPGYIGAEMIMTAQVKTIAEWGLKSAFNFSGALAETEAAVMASAVLIAQNSPLANHLALQQLRQAQLSLTDTLNLQAQGQAQCFRHGQVDKAILAFKNKTKFEFIL